MVVFGRAPSELDAHVTHKCDQQISMKFWQDAEETIPADATGNTIQIVVNPRAVAPTTWTAVVAGQTATWTLTDTDTDVDWYIRDAQLLIDGTVVAIGKLEVHR